MSERNTGYQFVSTDTEAVESLLISIYEKITGVSVKPASPEKLFIQFVAAVVIQERGLNNYTGNQNIPSRAEGENLDALAELFYVTQRPAAQAAVCTERFHISEAQTTAILIPAGTRVTDASGTLTWETVADAYVSIGETYADVLAEDKDGDIYPLVKAADKLSAYIKCIEERKAGNNEFLSAEAQTRAALEASPLPEVQYFLEHFIPAFERDLDELGAIGQ